MDIMTKTSTKKYKGKRTNTEKKNYKLVLIFQENLHKALNKSMELKMRLYRVFIENLNSKSQNLLLLYKNRRKPPIQLTLGPAY